MYLKLYCQKVDSTRNGKFRRLSGRFQILIWRPEKRFKIWSLPDYPGELTDIIQHHGNWEEDLNS